MFAFKVILAVVAPLVVAIEATEVSEIATGYLPLRDTLTWLPIFGKEIAQIMKDNPLSRDSPKSANEMLQIIRSKSSKAKEPKDREFFAELVRLSDPRAECTPSMRRTVLAILALALADGAKPAMQSYVAYLNAFAATKYAACAQDTAREFERAQSKLDQSVERGLDELFRAYVSAKGDTAAPAMGDQELYEAAKKMDFVMDAYKVRGMLKVSKEFMPRGASVDLHLSPGNHLALFIQNWCAQMQQSLEDAFSAFNLARAFGAQVDTAGLPLRFLKLNEYNRVCLTWQENRKAAEENLQRQVKASKWFYG